MRDDFELEEITIATLQARLASGAVSGREVVQAYLARIQAIDRAGPTLRSIIEINPDALDLADALDRERAQGRCRGPLHGIPIVLKDNIDTADRMQTTAGSLSLLDAPVERDAPVARKLRDAGALILAKANMSEWANFRSTRSSSGWSGRGRQTRNPFVLDRSPGGSSSGSGVAVSANLCMAALGTETDGSIMSPSSASGIVGIKPTVGLTSRDGVIPISHTQDTVGPHARTVADAAAVLSAIVDSVTDYRQYLEARGLKGARIGVARTFHTGYSEHTDRVFEQALEVLTGCGAVLQDVEIAGHAELRETFADTDQPAESLILQYEFKADLANYLSARPRAAVRNLSDVIRFNDEHADRELPYFGQERLVQSEARGPLTDELYVRALGATTAVGVNFARLFDEHRLAGVVAPTNAPAWVIDLLNGDRVLGGSAQVAAVCGFPLITVPAGFVADLLPIGLTFMGPARSEPALIRLAYAFEQAQPVRRVPGYVPSTLHLP